MRFQLSAYLCVLRNATILKKNTKRLGRGSVIGSVGESSFDISKSTCKITNRALPVPNQQAHTHSNIYKGG